MRSATVTRPASPLDVLALQYANPTRLITVPIGILVGVVVVTVGVTIAVVQAGGRPADMAGNGAVVWSLSGFIIAVGVQAVTAVFPLALALGTTRRTFTLGVLATELAQALLLTTASMVLLGLELVSGGWFVGARVLRDTTLGGGDPRLLAATVFLGALTGLAVGGLFGGSFVRFGSRGPMALGIGLAVATVVVLLLFLPDLVTIGAGFRTWWLAVAAIVIVLLATTGEHRMLRRASVR